MQWVSCGDLAGEDVTAACADGTAGVFVTTRSGLLLRAAWGEEPVVLARADAALFGLAAADGNVAAVGARGCLLCGSRAGVRRWDIAAEARLTSIVPRGRGAWLAAGAVGHRTGVLFSGQEGDWVRVGADVRLEEVLALAADGEGGTWIAGARGLLARVVDSTLESRPSVTAHPLRAVAVTAGGGYAGGGGWAENMPILLRIDGKTTTPRLSAGGDRIVVGLALDDQDVWLAEMKSDGQGWHGAIGLHGASGLSNTTAFPGQRIHGLARVGDWLVAWGAPGFLVRAPIPGRRSSSTT